MPTRFVCIALFLLIASVAFSQSRPASMSLPTYRQIKPVSQEIYDYVPRSGTTYQSVQRTFGLFDYPAEKTTYIVNGEIIDKISEVRAKVAEPGTHIDSLSVGAPDTNGKRLIRIRLLLNKQ